MSLLCAFFRNVDIFRLWLRNEHRHVTLHLIRGSLLMNALTAVQNNAVDSGQGQGNEQCFNSVFHTVFSLFVNSGITLTGVKTVNKWQCSEMEKAAKATFSCYS